MEERSPVVEVSSEGVEATDRKGALIWSYAVLASLFVPVSLAVLLYHFEPLNPAEYLLHELTHPEITSVPRVNDRVLRDSDLVGVGELVGPEDIAFDPEEGVLYTGCADGWVKRVAVGNEDPAVSNWVNTGGRPLGLALGLHNNLIVADPFKGLLNVSAKDKVEVLTDEAEGRKLIFVDGVDVAKDGMIYFSDASSKYSLPEFVFDVLEGKPHGSLMSFDPITKETKILIRDLYFPNGVQVSADQKSVIFCESFMSRCKKYIREGEKQGSVEIFVDNLPGFPDNIRYDGEGHYWIALGTSKKPYWEIALRYPFVRKVLAIVTRYVGRPHMERNAGLLAVDLEGKPLAHYYDCRLSLITGGNKIGNYLYFGSFAYPHLIRLNLDQHAAFLQVQDEL